MQLEMYTARLRSDLISAATLGDEQTQKTAAALGVAAESSARLILLEALSDFAAELSTQLHGQTVRVHLENGEARPEIRRDDLEQESIGEYGKARTEAGDYPTMDDVSGEVRRVTLRLVEQIKERAEVAASSNGISLNTWLSQAVQGALRDQTRKDRPRGY